MNDDHTICIVAPQAIAGFVLANKVNILHEKCPTADIQINPKIMPKDAAVLRLEFEPNVTGDYVSRNIGWISSKTYLHTISDEIAIIPDIIAGLDQNYKPRHHHQPPIIHTLWLSVQTAILATPGVRQAMDWVEACILGLTWLNDPHTA